MHTTYTHCATWAVFSPFHNLRICFDNKISKSLYMLYETRFYCFKKLNRVKKKKKKIWFGPSPKPIHSNIGLSKFKAQNSINKHSPKITCGQKGNLGLAIRVLGFAHIYNQTLFHFVPSRLVSLCTSLLNRSNGARRFLPQLYALCFSEISFRSEIWFRVYYFIS